MIHPVEVVSLGCRLNLVETEAMRVAAVRAGRRDIAIVNTCAVTAEAVRQSRQAVRRIARERPGTEIVVTGCAATLEPEAFGALPGVVRVLDNAAKADPSVWGPPRDGRNGAPDLSPIHTRAFVAVQTGCDHRCTFCIIPFGRGPSRSEPAGAVVDRIAALVEAGAPEAVLTGVDLTSWGADLPGRPTLGRLVGLILKHVPGLRRLRLSSIDCIEADPALLAAFADHGRLMPHLHLSLQSGHDLILKRMKRRHSRADAIAFCRELRRLRPDIVFGADLISGFPTETDAMAQATLDLVDACGLTHLHVFPYSPRPGTPAARMPPVAGALIRERAARLREKGSMALRQHLDRQIGRQLQVLTERGGVARAPDFTAVTIGDGVHGRLIDADVVGHDGRTLTGSPVLVAA